MVKKRVSNRVMSEAVRISEEEMTEKIDFLINETEDLGVYYPKDDDPWAQARSIVGTFPEDFMNDRLETR